MVTECLKFARGSKPSPDTSIMADAYSSQPSRISSPQGKFRTTLGSMVSFKVLDQLKKNVHIANTSMKPKRYLNLIQKKCVPVHPLSPNTGWFHFQFTDLSAWLIMPSDGMIDLFICPRCVFDPDSRSIAKWSRKSISGWMKPLNLENFFFKIERSQAENRTWLCKKI